MAEFENIVNTTKKDLLFRMKKNQRGNNLKVAF